MSGGPSQPSSPARLRATATANRDDDKAHEMTETKPFLVYLAGPLSHPDVLHQERNVERAMAVAYDVMLAGHQPIVPHLGHYLDRYWHTEMGESVEYETWMDWALALLERCDCLLYMGSSPGADRELTHAIQRGIPVYGSAGDLP